MYKSFGEGVNDTMAIMGLMALNAGLFTVNWKYVNWMGTGGIFERRNKLKSMICELENTKKKQTEAKTENKSEDDAKSIVTVEPSV
jgi:hypothetical protein